MEHRKAYRTMRGRMVAGVCAGLAEHLHVDVRYVRIAFALAAVSAKGAGLAAYLAFWALLPQDPEEAVRPREDLGKRGWLFVWLSIVIAGNLGMAALGFTSLLDYLIPLSLAVIGITLVWSRADEMQRSSWRREAAGVAREAASESARHGRWRVVVGAAGVLSAIVIVSVSRVGATTMLQGLATSMLLGFGVVLVAFPWLYERWRRYALERTERARADARADMAAHIHDSVLQTLTLLQRHSDDPQRVQQLARAEERELRAWLYGDEKSPESVAAALQEAANDVETRHGVTFEVVTVGDAPVDSRIEALLAAAQEAMVNAAKHSGAATASVFAEIEPGAISVFVRDRGRGFDVSSIAPDRAGLRASIEGRMERVGGTAQIRTREGDGTEIALSLPREAR